MRNARSAYAGVSSVDWKSLQSPGKTPVSRSADAGVAIFAVAMRNSPIRDVIALRLAHEPHMTMPILVDRCLCSATCVVAA
jgi:hypothetical protein